MTPPTFDARRVTKDERWEKNFTCVICGNNRCSGWVDQNDPDKDRICITCKINKDYGGMVGARS